MDEPLTPDEDRSVQAAELALGLLDGPDRAVALRRQLSDPDFAADVRAWEERLAPLHTEWADIQPHDSVWRAVAARIGDPAADQRALRRWRAFAVGSGAIAAGLAAMLLLQPAQVVPTASPSVAVAQMVGAASAPVILARYDAGSGRMLLQMSNVASGTLAPELWVIPVGGAPVSLGLIPADGQAAIDMTAQRRGLLVPGATLAVTLEPVDGAPHLAPSSTPIAAGVITVL